MIDQDKIVGVGVGYGAYLLNFWNGLEEEEKQIRFSAIISHGGVFDTRTMYYEMDVSLFIFVFVFVFVLFLFLFFLRILGLSHL